MDIDRLNRAQALVQRMDACREEWQACESWLSEANGSTAVFSCAVIPTGVLAVNEIRPLVEQLQVKLAESYKAAREEFEAL